MIYTIQTILCIFYFSSILQTVWSNTFLLMKNVVIWFKFVPTRLISLVPNMQQTIIYTSDRLV